MNVEVDRKPETRVCQGDLIRNVACVEDVLEDGDVVEIKRIVFPLVIVLTQDCDLQQDDSIRACTQKPPTTHNTQLLSVLVAPAYNSAHFELGEHLIELGLKMWTVPTVKEKGRASTEERILRQNKNPRYHYLQFDADIGIVDSVVDFKHYFSVNVQYLKRIKPQKCAGKLSTLYREDVSQRFASFLGRIGLPDYSLAPSAK